MFHKKTLSAAIAVALSFGVGAAQAASFQKYVDGATGATLSTYQFKNDTPLKYAYEQFGTAPATGTLAYPFRVRYTLTSRIPSDVDVYVSFSLSGGATWQNNLSAASLDIQDATGASLVGSGAVPERSIVNKGSTADSTVSFLINNTKKQMETSHILDFTFKIANAHKTLQSPGGKITLTANLIKAQKATAGSLSKGEEADVSLESELAVSQEGTKIIFDNDPDVENAAYISVASDGKNFEGAGIRNGSNTQVVYGVVGVSNISGVLLSTTTCVPTDYLNGASGGCTTGGWKSENMMKDGSIVIEDGNFSASGKASDGNLYIDVAPDVAGGPSKIIADEFTSPVLAKWVLEENDFDGMFLNGNKLTGNQIVLAVNGTTEINENRQTQPKATLKINFISGNEVVRTAFFRQLKKNGTVCTLYNIPPSDALDVLNIRVTNNSVSFNEAFVKGKLRDMDGKPIFQKTLIEQGNLIAHQTQRLTLEDLKAAGETWAGRAVLTLESNIPHPYMQVYGLLRAKEGSGFPETPLMNMSTGATGNSCD